MDKGNGFYGRRFNIPNLDLYYGDCVIGGPGAFLVVAEDFQDFARAVRRKLILEIAGMTPAAGAPRGPRPYSPGAADHADPAGRAAL